MFEIKKIEELLSNVLKEKNVISYKTERLTLPGENYGSLILAVEVSIENNYNNKETIHLVAKLLPENEELRKFFQVSLTFKKELEMYRSIAPTIKQLETERSLKIGFDFFPQFYGGRLSLNPKKENIDDNAAILLENLKVSGFKTVERSLGFNQKEAELILKELAKFHAISIALQVLNPKSYETNVKPHLIKASLFESTPRQQHIDLRNQIIEICNMNQDCRKLSNRLESSINKSLNSVLNNVNYDVTNPFCSIIHCDLWVNNIMLKYKNDEPAEVKFVDFQLYSYGLTGNDVIFFLLSSVQTSVVDKYYDNLIKLYYNDFIETLKIFKCDITPFDFTTFGNNLEYAAKSLQVFHALRMLKPIYAEKEDVEELKNIKGSVYMRSDIISEKHKKKAWFIIKKAASEKWI